MATIEQKKQMLLESFDILKDSWENKSNAIKKIIANMSVCDMSTAMEMWLYVIKRNTKSLTEDSWNLLEGILSDMEDKIGVKKLAKAVFANPTLVTYIFKENNYIGFETEQLLAYLIVKKDNSQLLSALQMIASNPHLGHSGDNIGEIITTAINQIDQFSDDEKIAKSTKEILYDFVSQIENKKERAEASVALLDLD